MAIRLYDYPLSGNCYKVRLLASLIGLDIERVPVDIFAGGSQTPQFLSLNPRGQVPVLEDRGEVIWDSMAILVYLARRYGGERWLPRDALGEARVMQWLAVSENELLFGLARARAVLKFGRPFDLAQCQNEGRVGLGVLERRLTGHKWLAADHPTIADIACFPYVDVAPEGEIPLDDYPVVQQWLARLRALPGFVPMVED